MEPVPGEHANGVLNGKDVQSTLPDTSAAAREKSNVNGETDQAHLADDPAAEAANGAAEKGNGTAEKANGAAEPAPTLAKSDSSEFKEIAAKLFNEDFVLIKPEEYTQFLASQDAESSAIRECYMDLFKWDASLMKSTRMLCLKLYLKGESQEIDRILLAFTKLYIKQHPVNVFCTRDFEKIYIVLYSLILLNTAIHNLELNKKSKISQTDYIRNTFSTFLQQNKKALRGLTIKQKIQIERELNTYYEDLAAHELYLKQGDDDVKPVPNTSPRKLQNPNRLSIAETIKSQISGHDETPLQTANINDIATTELSRQLSNSSIWSTDYDGGRRMSLAMKRMTLGTSTVSHITAVNSNYSQSTVKSSRVGFTRALLLDANQRGNTLRNQRSLDQMRQYGHNLGRRSSRASIITKESTGSQRGNDDAVSVLTIDDANVNHLDLGVGELHYQLEDFDVDDFQDRFDLKLELQGSPYLKEGLLKLKILNNDQADLAIEPEQVLAPAPRSGFFSFLNRPKAPARGASTLGTSSASVFNKFTEYFVVVSKGELRLYSFDPKVIKKHAKKIRKQLGLLVDDVDDDGDDIGDGNWLKNAANVGNYNLCSTIAAIEKLSSSSSPSLSKKINFSLTFPKVSKRPQKKFVFEAGTMEVASEFINTCNFWASKITAVPALEESLSSIQYGWTNVDALVNSNDAFKKMKGITKWEQLPKGVYLSNCVITDPIEGEEELAHEGMLKQFVLTLKYYNNLKGLYNTFTQTKTKFMKNFRRYSGTSNYKLVVGNYENRAIEYKAELSKYKSYLIMLGYGLKLRFDLEEEDRDEALLEQIKNDESIDKENEEAVAEELGKRKEADRESESELSRAVRQEIEKLIASSSEMHQLFVSDPHYGGGFDGSQFEPLQEDKSGMTLVKSPKTFSLSNFKELESSPINQLLTADGKTVNGETSDQALHQAKKELIMSFSTNTIREEEEPEDFEDTL